MQFCKYNSKYTHQYMMYNVIKHLPVYTNLCSFEAHKGPVIKLQMFSNVKTSRRMIRKDSSLKLTALLSTNYMLQCLAYGLSYFTSIKQTRRHCSPDTICKPNTHRRLRSMGLSCYTLNITDVIQVKWGKIVAVRI